MKTKIRIRHILKEAINKWGEKAQVYQAIEELAELIVELNHATRRAPNYDHLAEEVADVEITLEQVKIIFELHKKVIAKKEEKLIRLEKKIGEPNKITIR